MTNAYDVGLNEKILYAVVPILVSKETRKNINSLLLSWEWKHMLIIPEYIQRTGASLGYKERHHLKNFFF